MKAPALLFLALLTACSSKSESEARKAAPPPGDAAPAPSPQPIEKLPSYRVYPTARAAMAAVLELEPRVLGIGEYHERAGAASVQSTLHRFAALIDLFGGKASDFILETWVEDGKCGKTEDRVSKDVRANTQRPPRTQSEMLRLLTRAKKLGIRPHVLRLGCGDYDALLDKAGKVDYEKVLALVTTKLHDLTRRVLAVREKRIAVAKEPRRMILVYGGALHNDLYPYDAVAEYSYATRIAELPQAGYVELDLYVPEYVQGNELLRGEAWYPLLEKVASSDQVALIRRKKRSYILLMKKGLAKASPTKEKRQDGRQAP